MHNVYVGENHPVTRIGLKQLLQASGEFAVQAECDRFATLVEKTRHSRPTAIIAELSLPGGGGLEGLKALAREFEGLPILIFTQYEASQYAVRALKAGAKGYLCKSAPAEELIAALNALVKGGTYVSKEAEPLLTQLKAPRSKNAEAPHESLSNREYDVMLMIAKGMALKAIAEHLNLSTKTVSTYRHRILTKFAMRSNADIVEYVLKNQL